MALSALASTIAAENITVVPDFDLSRYLGTWHEIARLPMWAQKNCSSDVTARYTARNDSTVEVLNSCVDADGNSIVANGTAYVPDPEVPAKIKVTFAPEWWASWLPFLWADYWVIALDDADYQWAMVGEPGLRWLWILSRVPTLDQGTFDDLKERAAGFGYDLDPLIISGTVQ